MKMLFENPPKDNEMKIEDLENLVDYLEREKGNGREGYTCNSSALKKLLTDENFAKLPVTTRKREIYTFLRMISMLKDINEIKFLNLKTKITNAEDLTPIDTGNLLDFQDHSDCIREYYQDFVSNPEKHSDLGSKINAYYHVDEKQEMCLIYTAVEAMSNELE